MAEQNKSKKAGASAGKMVIRSKKATAAEIRATLMIKPANKAAARRANRAAEAAMGYRP